MKPFLSNLFVYHAEDPWELGHVERWMKGSGDFQRVWRPVEGWVAGDSPLPLNPVLPQPPGIPGLVFAETGGQIGAGGKATNEERLGRLGRLAADRPEKLAQVPGEFGFVQMQPAGEVTVVRSCGGVVPFYFHQGRGRCAVGTRLADFVIYLPEEPGLNPFVNALWLSCPTFPEGASFLETVSVLPRGHFAKLGPARVSQEAYWDPVPQSVSRSPAHVLGEKAKHLRETLLSNLAGELDPEGLNLISLSGGVDSASLAVLASPGHRIASVSIVSPAPERRNRDLPHIKAIVDEYGIESSRFYTYDDLHQIRVRAKGPEVVFHVPHPLLLWLPKLTAELPVTTFFGGEFADWLCGSYLTMPDWISAVSLPRLLGITVRNELPFGGRDVLRWAKHRSLNLTGRRRMLHIAPQPTFIRQDLQERFNEWLNGQRKLAGALPSGRRQFGLGALADGFVPMNWEVASRLGVRRSFPFFGRDLLEMAYQTHPEDLVGPGPKKLLRQALHKEVPEAILHREKYMGESLRVQPRPWETDLPESLSSIVTEEWFPRPRNALTRNQAQGLAQLVRMENSWNLFRHKRVGQG